MSELGVLYLPSGPGLNSGPAQVFLKPIFSATGKTVFWNEPSLARGDELPAGGPLEIWKNVRRSVLNAALEFSGSFVIVTESYGSLLAEHLYDDLERRGDASRVAGILHSPPTLDLARVFRTVMRMGEEDFRTGGDLVRERKMQSLRHEVDLDPRIDSPALIAGIHLAFESPVIMTHYFRSLATLGKWASGFATEGFSPDGAMRDLILKGMGEAKAPVCTTFAPDVPTLVCGGGFDPYEKIFAFEEAIAKANGRPGRNTQISFVPFPQSGHYAYADELERWISDVWTPFLRLVRGT